VKASSQKRSKTRKEARKTGTDIRSKAVAAGYRSGLEHKFSDILKKSEYNDFQYEAIKLQYIQPQQRRFYLPDFYLPKYDLYIETKGRLTSSDRKKMLLVLEQHPDLNFLFVFGQPNNKIDKRSSTTYAAWCEKNNILWCSIDDFEENPKKCLSSLIKKYKVGKPKTLPKKKKTPLLK
jgi:hypothetical protein